jgi:hypothetical protein
LFSQILPEQPSIFIGSRVIEVQFRFGNTYGFKPTDYQGSFDGFMLDNDPIELGEMKGVTYNLPGHTPDSMARESVSRPRRHVSRLLMIFISREQSLSAMRFLQAIACFCT